MYETPLVVVGTVLTDPQTKETATGTKTTFRLGSTARKKDNGEWVEGDELFLTVLCWRSLSANVRQCVHKGDPVIVNGRLRTRQFEHEGQQRSIYELLANNIGHDLSRGSSEFRRNRPAPPPWEVADGARDSAEDEHGGQAGAHGGQAGAHGGGHGADPDEPNGPGGRGDSIGQAADQREEVVA